MLATCRIKLLLVSALKIETASRLVNQFVQNIAMRACCYLNNANIISCCQFGIEYMHLRFGHCNPLDLLFFKHHDGLRLELTYSCWQVRSATIS